MFVITKIDCNSLSCKIYTFHTVCFTTLDYMSEMIIYESISTTFEESFNFQDSCGSSKNWLELKIKEPLSKFSMQKSLKHTVSFCDMSCVCELSA